MHQSQGRAHNCVPLTWSPLSGAANRLIDLIVGKGLADQRDMARYEKHLSNAPVRNKSVRAPTRETPLPLHSPTEREMEPLLERTRSVGGTLPPQGSIRPPRVRRQTLQPVQDEYVTPPGAPDISAADIPEEQVSRTYSQSCVWDPKTNPVPPMQEMEGFGRFRRSVHADAAWELRRFRGDLQTLGPAAMQQLGDFEIARLKDGVMNNIRTSSCTSLASHSDSGESSTGPRICRGFKLCKTSPAVNQHPNRSKSMSSIIVRVVSPFPNEQKGAKWGPAPKRSSFLRQDLAPAPLPTIQESAGKAQRKKTVPLIFDTQGKADDVIDDDEYETCDESSSPAKDDEQPKGMIAPLVAPKWPEKKAQTPQITLNNRYLVTRNHRSSDHLLEKAQVNQKKLMKSATRRWSSRSAKPLANRVTSKESIAQKVEAKRARSSEAIQASNHINPPLALVMPKNTPASPDGSPDDNPVDLALFMVEPEPRTAMSETNDKSTNRRKSTNLAVQADVESESSAEGWDSSDATLRSQSGNIPIVYVADDVKQLVEDGKIERQNLQLVAA